MNEKVKYIELGISVALLLLCTFVCIASARTWYVLPGESIQAAVNTANPDDTIVVRDGTYLENVDVNKRLTIRSENGFASTIIQAAKSYDPVFEITADYVTICGFTVEGADIWRYDGIKLKADHCSVLNNKILNTNYGIDLYRASNSNTISDNTISSNMPSSHCGIHLACSCNNNIISRNTISNSDKGIYLACSNDNIISGNTISNNDDGIYLCGSRNNDIRDNIFVNDGLFVRSSYDNTVENNTVNGKPLVYLEDETDYVISSDEVGQIILVNCSNITAKNFELSKTTVGIELWKTNNSKIINNNIHSNNNDGVYLNDSNGNIISGNTISNNDDGIYLCGSRNNDIRDNIFVNDGLFVRSSYDNTVESNTVNGKPLVYIEDESDRVISNDEAGQLILVNCSNITAKNFKLTKTTVGIELWRTNNSKIINNNIDSNNNDGMYLGYSNNNIISGNHISDNNDDGVDLSGSSNNTISDNNISNGNFDGIFLCDSSNHNTISSNCISYNKNGIRIDYSHNNTISENSIMNNYMEGITGYGSNNNMISGNHISDNENAMWLYRFSNNTISKNTISNHYGCYGIFLCDSSNHNTISSNHISENDGDGICFRYSSSNNIIYHNNFMDNRNNAFFDSSSLNNLWNSPSRMTYTYKGNTYTNYTGNYWDDYDGLDDNSDGIGDTPYSIDGDKDNYPLMTPFYDKFPIISDISVTPTVILSRGYINITANISDDVGLSEVYLYVWDYKNPASKVTNPAWDPKGARYYHFSAYYRLPDNIGDKNKVYGIKILAKDTSGQIAQTDYIDVVVTPEEPTDTQPPTLSNSSINPSSGTPGTNFVLSVCAKDNIGVILVTGHVFDPDGILIEYVPMSLKSGDGKNGYWEGTYGCLSGAKKGEYTVEFYATDQTANDVSGANATFIITVKKIISVDDNFIDDPPNHKWDTIQEGINDANDGEVVMVYNGTYYENVIVNKSLILKGIGMPFVDTGGSGCAIIVTADGCTIGGFNLIGGSCGIILFSSNNSIIENNSISNPDHYYMSEEDIGIGLGESSNNTISNNNILNKFIGICGGGEFGSSPNNKIFNNNVSNCYWGIGFGNSPKNTIYNNSITNNYYGIYLGRSNNNIVTNNNALNNILGIYLDFSSNNTLTNNNAANNDYGICSYESSKNKIYLNNFIDNRDNVYFESSANTWNSTKKITYVHNEKTYKDYLGNYWDDYTGIDLNEDGIGDTPYVIGLDRDNYPLMEPWQNYIISLTSRR